MFILLRGCRNTNALLFSRSYNTFGAINFWYSQFCRRIYLYSIFNIISQLSTYTSLDKNQTAKCFLTPKSRPPAVA